jgi:iron(III) transport system substrate-binding protein
MSRYVSIIRWLFHGAVLAAVCSQYAGAQSAERNSATYLYEGGDRTARLAERARQEGALVLYTSLATSESVPLTQAFEKKTGVKVQLWRALSGQVLQRTLSEAQAGRNSVDVIETNGPEMEELAREKITSRFFTPYLADLPAWARPAHGRWASDRVDFFVAAFNTAKVRREELPASYDGFLDPKWKGRIGVEATDQEWLQGIVKTWGAQRGMDFFRKLAAMKPEVRKGHVLMSQLVASGEVQVNLTNYSANAQSMKKKGQPIDWKPVQPVIGRPQAIGAAAAAPHPNAALLFIDFVLSPEGQQLFDSMGRPPASTKVRSSLGNFPTVMLDPANIVDESPKWQKLWNDALLPK